MSSFIKTLLFLFLLTMTSLKVSSQQYISFPDSAARWVNTSYEVDWSAGNPFPDIILTKVDNYCCDGSDTLIANQNYTQIKYCSGAYKGAFRDDAGKVFFVPKDSITEFLLYDFNANPGDTIYQVYIENPWGQTGLYDFIIGANAIDSILINGVYRKRISLDIAYWIEGIGNTQGLFFDPWANVSNYLIELHCMSVNDTTLFPATGTGPCNLDVGIEDERNKSVSVTISPNPTTGETNILLKNFGNESTLIQVFNFSGQTISEPMKFHTKNISLNLNSYPSGMYYLQIQNGTFNTMKKIILTKQ